MNEIEPEKHAQQKFRRTRGSASHEQTWTSMAIPMDVYAAEPSEPVAMPQKTKNTLSIFHSNNWNRCLLLVISSE